MFIPGIEATVVIPKYQRVFNVPLQKWLDRKNKVGGCYLILREKRKKENKIRREPLATSKTNKNRSKL